MNTLHILKSFVIAISMYSKVPVPQFAWKEEDMRYSIVFFPFVGGIIGALFYFWQSLCDLFAFPNLARVLLAGALPFLISGGIHADGLMDTSDALHSYADRDKKLAILKDPHIGAFAVLSFASCLMMYLAGISLLRPETMLSASLVFVFSRCLSAISVLTFRSASGEGTLYQFAKTAAKKVCLVLVLVEAGVCAFFLLYLDLRAGLPALLTGLLFFLYYRLRAYSAFGGITGDVAGWFVCICETLMLLVLGIGGSVGAAP